LVFAQDGLDDLLCKKLNIWSRHPDLSVWEELAERVNNPEGETTIGIVGKYVHLIESYKSLNEALVHGGIAHRVRVHLQYIPSDDLEEGNLDALAGVDAILVPGGFGERGTEGKIAAIRYARERGVPFLGICLGMQMAVVEFARNVAGLEKANSCEFNESTPHPVIDLMEAQKEIKMKGGTMRLGAYPCVIKPGTLAHKIYAADEISERHRHRYEVNNSYVERLTAAGLRFSGTSPDGSLCETIELDSHPWFFGSQFHPEYKSKPILPHPVFVSYVRAALDYRIACAEADDKEAAVEADSDVELAGALLQATPGGVSPEG
jgi:CTP synthase